jgi:hypothetical protein
MRNALATASPVVLGFAVAACSAGAAGEITGVPYRGQSPTAGDIVSIDMPDRGRSVVMISAVEGQTANGNTIPTGYVYVAGRDVKGFVPKKFIVGRVEQTTRATDMKSR